MSDIVVSGLCLDSRRITFGDLFIALKGSSQDGRNYIPLAIEQGAKAVLAESPLEDYISRDHVNSIPIIQFPNLRNSVSSIAGRFFGHPSQALKVIGITGTSGKTSTTHWIAQLFAAQKQSCAVLGSLGQGFLSGLKTQDCTTPDPILTQKYLADFVVQGASAVAMEVSSHALTQGRVEGIQFHTAIFTNLTHDHLDYHPSMEDYFQAKRRLFTELKPEFTIVNVEDPYGARLIQDLSDREEIIGYTLDSEAKPFESGRKIPVISAKNILLEASKTQALLESPWGEAELICPLLGRFNLSNVLGAIAALCVQGFSFHKTVEAAQSLTPVPGRMMSLGGGSQPWVFIDFAHKPDALAQVLMALRALCRGRLWCVFGCGGDRDRRKRSQMGKIAEELGDEVVITQDNSRTESFSDIQKDILQGIRVSNRVRIESDRAKAIQWAIESAQPEDIVLIAGKGQEDYQIIEEEKIPFSDYAVARQVLDRRQG